MKIKITSDSTCDLSQELLDRHHIGLVPLGIVKEGEIYHDGVDITPQEIIDHVNRGGNICSTNAVNVAEYDSFFRPLAAEYDAVIHINLGAGFSCSHQNAKLATAELDNVYVVDSANLSSGQGHLVMEAALHAEAGETPERILAHLEDVKPRIETSFLLERLDFMQKGGRCSATMAIGANLLKIRPCIEVRDGQMVVGKKYRGRYDKCIGEYIADRVAKREDIIRSRAFITHPPTDEAVLAVAHQQAEALGGFAELYDTPAGCTITCHCGYNCLGILFIRQK